MGKKEEETLKEEMETFEEHKADLLKKHEGKYVLIKGKEIIGVFDTQNDALVQSYQRFKGESFLVKQILAVETPLDFTSNMLGRNGHVGVH